MRSILTVTSAAASTVLTTVDRVRADLSLGDDVEDETIETKIAEASDRLVREIRFFPFRESVRETFRPTDCAQRLDSLVLDRTPVASITSVVIDDTTLSTGEIEVDKVSGLLYRLTTDGYRACWSVGKSAVVTYVAGWLGADEDDTDLPPALQGACVDYLRHLFASQGRDPMIKAEDVPGVGRNEYWVGATGAADALPPDVQAKIAPFIRPSV